MRSPFFPVALLGASLSSFALPSRAEDAPVIDKSFIATSRREARQDPDYLVQGEYAGSLTMDGQPVKLGLQVVALGGGEFVAFAYLGGLPGDGWNGEERIEAGGKTSGGVTRLEAKGPDHSGAAVIQDGRATIYDGSGNKVGELERARRRSPTLGAKPPEGAVVLFDGTSAEGFVTDGGKPASMTERGHLKVRADSVYEHGSGTLHVEFRTPYKPFADRCGQDRGNSGVYLQSRYEVQVLDSFACDPKWDLCGGVYSVAPPKLNMCFPPLTWQTYDMEFEAAELEDDGKTVKKPARLTVRHNGVLIHEGQEVSKKTTAAPQDVGPAPKPLHLQGHGNPVVYRNIWFVPAKAAE